VTVINNQQNSERKPWIQQSDLPGVAVSMNKSLGNMGIADNISVFDHTTFARKLIENHITSKERKEDLINRINEIEKKAKDPFLYLAVVGEFSSGKSTFINGMLRQRLLKSAYMVTTASVTHIKPGNEFVVTANFIDGEIIKASKNDFKKLESKLRKLKSDLCPSSIDLNYLLDLLTSEQSIAENLTRIDIEVPSVNLLNDVSIIDTPGINPGESRAEGHRQITQNVVDAVADAAIILIPSSSPMSSTLINFLDNKARHFLHRCIFVVTAMDRQNEEERESTINFVKLKLEEKLNLSNPIVLQSGAITMVPVKNIPSSMQASWEYWQDQFKQLEVTIRQKMIRERRLIISEHLIRLLQELNKDMNVELEEVSRKYVREETLLKQNSVESIEKVLGILYDQSAERIEKDMSSMKSYLGSEQNVFCSAAKADVANIINNSRLDPKNYKKKDIPKIKEIVDKHGKAYLKSTETKLNILRNTCLDICDDFGRKFEASYTNLPFLGAKITVPSLSVPTISVPAISIPNTRFSVSKDHIKRQIEVTSGMLKSSGLVVAAIFIHLGLAGLLIGAIIVVAIIIFGSIINSHKENKEQLRDSIDKDIDIFFGEYNRQITANLERIQHEMLSQLKNSVSMHIREYYSIVNELIESHKKEENRLKKDIQQLNWDISELSSRNKKLDDIKKSLEYF